MSKTKEYILEFLGRWTLLLGATLIAGKAISGVTAGVLSVSRWVSTSEFLWFLFALAMGLQSVFGVNRKLITARPDLAGFVYWGYFLLGMFFLALSIFFIFLKPSYYILPSP